MVNFEDVRAEMQLLSAAINDQFAGGDVVDSISVPEPSGVKDELYFRKLVSWSYVALVEAFPVAFRQITALLRSSDKASHTRISETKEAVQAIRTLQSHNTVRQSASNERQKNVAEAWIVMNGGNPFTWEGACINLCVQIVDLLNTLRLTLLDVLRNEEDRSTFVSALKVAIDGDWPAYLFDGIVQSAADSLGLGEFDVVAYRKIHFENWRKLAALFCDRQAAIEAITRVIFQELRATFGDQRSGLTIKTEIC